MSKETPRLMAFLVLGYQSLGDWQALITEILNNLSKLIKRLINFS